MKVNDLKKLAKQIEKGKIKYLKPTDKFQFKCTACGKCCFNIDVIVGIYDLVRLRNALKLSTQDIIKNKLVDFYLGPTSGLPLLTIGFQKIAPKVTRCPFLVPAIHFDDIIKKLNVKSKTKKLELIKKYKKDPKSFGKILEGVKIDKWLCSIHKHRPMICRLYPLGRIKETKKDSLINFKERFILQNKESGCPGWKTKHEYTLKSFLDECEFWQYKDGSDKSHAILDLLMTSGFFAPLKIDKKSKNKPLFKRNSPILSFMGNLIYNFDSINYFSNDKRVVKTINEDCTHKDFMYVVEKINTIVKRFIQLNSKLFKGDYAKLEQFLNKLKKGGDNNA